MDTRTGSFSSQRTYEDFVPPQQLLQEETADTLLLELAGFRKEQIKVQIDNYGKLRISGERPIGANKWIRFRKEYQVPENCNFSAIRAKYENGLVSITLPKIVAPQLPSAAPDQTTNQADKRASQPSEPSQQPSEGPSDVPTGPTSSEKKKEKRSEPVVDGQKEEEPKDTSKAADEAKHDSTEQGQDDTSEPPAEEISSSSRLEMLKQKMADLSTRMYNSRKAIWIAFAVLVVSIGVGLMLNYKLNDNTMETDRI